MKILVELTIRSTPQTLRGRLSRNGAPTTRRSSSCMSCSRSGRAPPQMHQGYAPELEDRARRRQGLGQPSRDGPAQRRIQGGDAGWRRRCPRGHHRHRHRLARRPDRRRLARPQRHTAVPAGQRVGVRRPPRPMFRRDRAHAGESLSARRQPRKSTAASRPAQPAPGSASLSRLRLRAPWRPCPSGPRRSSSPRRSCPRRRRDRQAATAPGHTEP